MTAAERGEGKGRGGRAGGWGGPVGSQGSVVGTVAVLYEIRTTRFFRMPKGEVNKVC